MLRQSKQKTQQKSLWLIIAVSFLLFFGCSSLRHWLFQSAGMDLGIFDQAIYLISVGQAPISSYLGFHILSDHAAFILYPISLLYRLYPTVHWLFAVQALALAIAAYPAYKLALLAGLAQSRATLVSAVYLLYPVAFNVSVFDFHPDAIAMPAIFWMVLAARTQKVVQFCMATAIVLSCKAAFSLTVAAMGLWLLLFERRKRFGAIALAAGVAWFLIAVKLVIPAFSAEDGLGLVSRHLFRYGDLGSSYGEVAIALITQPRLMLTYLIAPTTLEYFVLLIAPAVYLLLAVPKAIKSKAISSKQVFRTLCLLTPAIPVLAMNILSTQHSQRNLVQWYSLPVVPFIILIVITYLKASNSLSLRQQRKQTRFIISWAVVAFLSLSRLITLVSPPYTAADTFAAARTAISRVVKGDSVLTTSEIAPHLSHRGQIEFTNGEVPLSKVDTFEAVLLNTRYPGWNSSILTAMSLQEHLEASERFRLDYQQDGVYLFVQTENIQAEAAKK